MLPYADSFYVEIAQSAMTGACFSSDITDQFLTMLAMEGDAQFDGDSDFGSLTRIDLDEELRVVLTVLDAAATWGSDKDGRTDEVTVDNLRSHYTDAFAVIGEGSSQKWWADWYVYRTEAEADAEMAQFAERYSDYLGCEDCGRPTDECKCDEPEAEHPFVTEVKDAERMGEAFGPAE